MFDGLPVQYRYEGNIFSGEKRSELLVVPAFSVRVSPEIAIVPVGRRCVRRPRAGAAPAAARPGAGGVAGRGAAGSAQPRRRTVAGATREVRVTVVNDTQGAAESVVTLEAAAGMDGDAGRAAGEVRARGRIADRALPGAGRRRARRPASITSRAVVTSAAQTFDRGYQVIEYPHIRRQHIYDAADATLKVIDVKTAPNLTVGYIMGVGDEVPPAIEQLGAKVEMIGADDLAWGNLSRFDTIVTGVRAYERRGDLRANNSRLLDYVTQRRHAHRAVQQVRVQRRAVRAVSGEGQRRSRHRRARAGRRCSRRPIRCSTRRTRSPTRRGRAGCRSAGCISSASTTRATAISSRSTIRFPYNKGEKRGALVAAQYGKGRWVYVGLGLWRELPAGVDGAYQLLANLISLGTARSAAAADRQTAEHLQMLESASLQSAIAIHGSIVMVVGAGPPARPPRGRSRGPA